MTRHIIDPINQAAREQQMARQTLTNQLPREVAQIVIYMVGSDNSVCVRYTDMKTAVAQHKKLLEAADKGKSCVLTGAASTCVVQYPQNMALTFVVDMEANNALMVDTQKRANAMMQA